MLNGSINVKSDNIKQVTDLIKNIAEKRVMVGVLEDKTARKNNDAETNASILYKNTVGSPLERIPPRPLLEPAIENKKDILAQKLREAINKALAGNIDGYKRGLAGVGAAGEQAVKMWFDDPQNNWAPNTEYTKRMKGSDHPLIDTGQLRQSIHYEIRPAEGSADD